MVMYRVYRRMSTMRLGPVSLLVEGSKSKIFSTQPSLVVPHRTTTWARGSLTALFGWEAVTLPDVAEYESVGGVAYMYFVQNNTFPPPTRLSRTSAI